MARRIAIGLIPDKPCKCLIDKTCVYKKDGVCEMPRTYKGNSDAACHYITNKVLLWQLEIIKIN